ncbi:MAG: hypothetical protein JWM90_1626 [Thermoleophilia bacterium]|nr:hypothetical protein [Thermoleophilia bacterium]
MPACLVSIFARATARPADRERGFGLVELIVAMLILSVVVSGAAVAVTSSDSSARQTKAVADLNAIATRGFERIQGDLAARSSCESGASNWRNAASLAVRSGTTTATNFPTCTVTYNDLTDQDSRRYNVTMTLKPVDDASDGAGADDADHNLRDDYKVSARVELVDKAGLEGIKPIEVPGSVDWGESTNDLASVRVSVCGISRPDRSLSLGGCASGDTNREPVAGIRVALTPSAADAPAEWNTADAKTLTSSTSGIAEAVALVEPGSYRVTVSIPSNLANTWEEFRVDPVGVRIVGSGKYEINVTLVRKASRTITVCTQLGNYRAPDDGYEVDATNVHYRRFGSPAFRTINLQMRQDRQWACTKINNATQPFLMRDPLSYSDSAYAGQYDIDVEQVVSPTGVTGLSVMSASLDCTTGVAYNQPLGGTPIATRARDASNDRALGMGEATPWLGRYTIADATANHRVCIRFNSKQFDRARCAPNSGSGCFYVRTDCAAYCPSGAQVCVANCNFNPPGSLSTFMGGESAKPFGGPSDETVGCRPWARGGYQWYGWNPGLIWEGFTANMVPRWQWEQKQWVGGQQWYYDRFAGLHSYNNTPFQCENVVFAASSQWLCHEGTNTPVYTGNGFYGCRYRFNDCVQVELAGYPGVFVRGRVWDYSTNYTAPVMPSINALRELAVANSLPRPETIDYWNPGSWWTNLNVNVWKVSGDAVCDRKVLDGWKRWEYRAPAYVEIWEKIVDDPTINDAAPKPIDGNVGQDKVAV